MAGAEDALADAFAAALAQWPRDGTPANPEAWLLTVARRRLHDRARRQATAAAGAADLRMLMEEAGSRAAPGELPDERLALMFACAHPAIEAGVRAPLMLQAILGFDAAMIASAFLVAPATMGQRLVRAKARVRQTEIPFAVPGREELPERLDAVLEAIYATFTGGWVDPAGTDPRRRNLADEGIWLGRLVARLMPRSAEALGLLALMLFAEARRGARRDASGAYVPLARQDPARWDAALIAEAEALLTRAGGMGSIGRFQLEAALQSAHAARRRRARLRRDRAALRGAVADDRLAGGGPQPRGGAGRGTGPGGGARRARDARGRSAPCHLPAMVGGEGRAAGPRRTGGSGGRGIRPGDRAGERSGGARFPDGA